MAPFGFITDGLDEDVVVDAQGERWEVAEKLSEYGDRSYMWEFQ